MRMVWHGIRDVDVKGGIRLDARRQKVRNSRSSILRRLCDHLERQETSEVVGDST